MHWSKIFFTLGDNYKHKRVLLTELTKWVTDNTDKCPLLHNNFCSRVNWHTIVWDFRIISKMGWCMCIIKVTYLIVSATIITSLCQDNISWSLQCNQSYHISQISQCWRRFITWRGNVPRVRSHVSTCPPMPGSRTSWTSLQIFLSVPYGRH